MAKLYFRYGAMGCGKTMQLLQVAFNYEERGMKVCVIKPATDTKNGDKLLTRIGPERETDFCFSRETNLYDKIRANYLDVQCILVDEAQFLTKEQVDDLMRITIDFNIPVMAYGLRLNFRREDGGFEGATRLLQIAHDIEELKTICDCGRKATYNARFLNGKLVADGPDVLIDDGTSEITYRAICPACYEKYLAEGSACVNSEKTGAKLRKKAIKRLNEFLKPNKKGQKCILSLKVKMGPASQHKRAK